MKDQERVSKRCLGAVTLFLSDIAQQHGNSSWNGRGLKCLPVALQIQWSRTHFSKTSMILEL